MRDEKIKITVINLQKISSYDIFLRTIQNQKAILIEYLKESILLFIIIVEVVTN